MLSRYWQLQDAKNKFSHLVNLAKNMGPQIVTKHGKEVAVVLSISEYKKLTKPETNLAEFFKNSPLAEADLELERENEYPRDIEL